MFKKETSGFFSYETPGRDRAEIALFVCDP
jgi:hypothetical protein